MTPEEKREYDRKRYSEKKEEIQKQKKLYREKNKDKWDAYFKEHNKQYQQNNKQKLNDKAKEYYQNNKDKAKEYYQNNKETIKDKVKVYQKVYQKERKANDPLYKLTRNIRTSISQLIKKNGFKKLSKTELILGCSFQDFKEHLESQFEDWMSWDNYGNCNGISNKPNMSWDIDHYIPTSSATTESELLKLNHYTNLKPMCSYINRYIKKANNPTK